MKQATAMRILPLLVVQVADELTATEKSAAPGQERHFSLALAVSALPLTADLKLGIGTGSEGPEGDNPNQPDNGPFANGLA